MKKFIFTTIFIVINICILEIGLYLLDPEEIFVKGFDKELLFRMYPKKKGIVASEEFSVTVETNSDGYRQKIKKDSQEKVLIMGDSFTEGWGVEENEIYVEKLNSFTKDIFFINAGLHGSSPSLYAIQIPYVLNKYKPTQVIVQIFDNDLDDNEKLERFIQFNKNGEAEKPKPKFLANLITEKGYNFLKDLSIYRFFSKLIKVFKKEPSPILYYKLGREPKIEILTHEKSILKFGKLSPLGKEINLKYGNQFGFYKDSSDDLWKNRLSKNLIYLTQIIQTAKKQNIPISFLYIPAKEFFAKGGILGDKKIHSSVSYESANPLYLQIYQLCTKEKLNCTFLTKDFFERSPENLYFPFDAHLNRKGHQVLAEILYEKFLKNP
ncbi:MAG: GDSL family lipase [Leptospiraceae bacterium]|nr:GDSL family lipase [Leptospiraceae bacterium]MCK6381385.1 GDSL family lipase [Leptospiraceae bacterium]